MAATNFTATVAGSPDLPDRHSIASCTGIRNSDLKELNLDRRAGGSDISSAHRISTASRTNAKSFFFWANFTAAILHVFCRCERCSHEWIPRNGQEAEPRVCPKCHSPYWNSPRRSMMAYDDFREKIATTLHGAGRPLTWTEIRTAAGLPQLFPNNQWVHRLEKDIGLHRSRDAGGIVHWQLTTATGGHDPPAKAPEPARARARRKQSSME